MIVITMGVVGAGKTTIGTLLASQLGWEFADADAFHPQSNIDNIRKGIPLTDADRDPWLERLRNSIGAWIASGKNVVLACSALKRIYRAELNLGPQVRFVYLKGSEALIAERLHSRHGHFATESILSSQLADLEEPESAVTVNIDRPPSEIVAHIKKALQIE